jgi:hypothetical protein
MRIAGRRVGRRPAVDDRIRGAIRVPPRNLFTCNDLAFPGFSPLSSRGDDGRLAAATRQRREDGSRTHLPDPAPAPAPERTIAAQAALPLCHSGRTLAPHGPFANNCLYLG